MLELSLMKLNTIRQNISIALSTYILGMDFKYKVIILTLENFSNAFYVYILLFCLCP